MNPVVCNLPGQSRMLDVVRSLLRTSDHFAIAVSFLRYSGLGLLSDDLNRFFERGGTGKLLTSTYLGITQPEALKSLLRFDSLECRLHIAGTVRLVPPVPITGFHSKLYILGSECIVGSSNMTKGGLAANIESNLRCNDSLGLREASKAFVELWQRSDTVPLSAELIQTYAAGLSIVAPLQPATPPIPFRTAGDLEYTGGNSQLDLLPVQAGIVATPCPNEAQLEAMERLATLRSAGERRAAVVAATGIGKTYLAAFDAKSVRANSILFVSHRLEHLAQAQRTFECVFGRSRTYGRLYEGHDEANADIVFATVASANTELGELQRSFDYVVVDEFHHASARSYRKLLSSMTAGFLLGLTATPERQDGHDVLELCDWNVAYEIRVIEAINRGWLLPFHYFGIRDESVDYGTIPWRSGRFDPELLEVALMLEERVSQILHHAEEKGFDGIKRTTVGFCAGVRHARFMAKSLIERGCTAVAVTGSDSLEYREAVYRRLEDPADPLEWLFVADVLNEGVDIPSINSLLFLRPTESATVFIQQLGRGLRLSPGCEVLTVLDFVGHERSAWLAVEALGDRDAQSNGASASELGITPPRNCEIVLDDQTLAILKKIKKHASSRRDECLAAYRRLRDTVERPMPLDLWGRDDMPGLAVVRDVFGSWIGLRIAADDAELWESSLNQEAELYRFLSALERDWQQQRVYSYALLWGLCAYPDAEPEVGYAEFWKRFPRWTMEFKSLDNTKAWPTLRKKLTAGLHEDRLDAEIVVALPRDILLAEVEGRIRLVLEKDYKTRHGGILRTPSELVLHRRYERPEIVNYFGRQFDPAIHNFGVIEFGSDIVIITKLDTTGAQARFQYSNKVLSASEFQWQSQNQQGQNNAEGRMILDHRHNGRSIHLFVQSKSHSKAAYFGRVNLEPESVSGDKPMTVRFRLEHELSDQMLDELQGKI